MCKLKKNDYQAITIFMEIKISASTNRNTITQDTKSYVENHIVQREKPQATLRNIYYENKEYNSQVYAKLESTMNCIYNK